MITISLTPLALLVIAVATGILVGFGLFGAYVALTLISASVMTERYLDEEDL